MTRVAFDVIKTIEKYSEKPLKDCKLLDIGCWDGRISLSFVPLVKSVTGVDRVRSPDFAGHNVNFIETDVFNFLNACDDKFDIIICSELIEHVAEHETFLKGIGKCLSDKGLIYLTTNNKFWWKEAHYGLPFLSYLPKTIQDTYIRLSANRRTGVAYCEVVNLFSYGSLKRLFDKCGFIPVFVAPEGLVFPYSILKYVTRGPMWNLSKGFLVIAKRMS